MAQELFADIIGHETVIERLKRAVSQKRVAHAYLFVGPEGVGKTKTAMNLMQRGGAQVETVVRLTDEKTGKLKSDISVNQIRDLCERLALTSFGGETKCAFIEEADALNANAANAFLKTLEEPRGDTLIILRTSHRESVPATIASRCEVLSFRLVPVAPIAAWLRRRGCDREEADELARLSAGRPGHALSLLQDGAFRAEQEVAGRTLLELVESSLPARFKTIADLLPKDEANKAVLLEQTLDGWERMARDIYLSTLGCRDLVTHRSESGRIDRIAAHSRPARWAAVLRSIAEVRRESVHHVSPQLGLEHIALSF